VPSENDYVYGLLKLREQEHDAEGDSPADGDTPGVIGALLPIATYIPFVIWRIKYRKIHSMEEENEYFKKNPIRFA
jgi:hypothetical protein